MPVFHDQSREQLRRTYVEAWRKHRERVPLEPLEALLADLIALHPEYHALLEGDDALDRDWTPEQGQTNPFLHLSLHVAIREGLATDRPPGIAAAHRALSARLGDGHAVEHVMLDALGETLWEAQRANRPPDAEAYLERVRAAARR